MRALINIPFIDASGIVIKLREIFIVDNGVDMVSSTGMEQKFVPQICPYVRFGTTDHTIGRVECTLNGLYRELRDHVHFADRVVNHS